LSPSKGSSIRREAAANMGFQMFAFHEHVNRWQFVLICAIAAIDGADLAMLGACFRVFEEELHMGPTQLSTMALAQALTGSFAAPLWGWLCDKGVLSRRQLWGGGTLGWGMVMLGLAASSSFPVIVMLRLLNGIFLASLTPLLQSWVAESVKPQDSGRIFGMVLASTTIGIVGCTAIAVSVGSSKVDVHGLGSVSGWRIMCAAIGLVAFVISALTWCFFEQPKGPHAKAEKDGTRHSICWGFAQAFIDMALNVRDHWKSHTFRIIVCQGILGGTAAQAGTFEIMFFMYVGMSPAQLTLMSSIAVLPSLVSSPLGGMFGDCMEKRFPEHGRAYTAQICVAGLMSFIAVQLLVLPGAFGAAVVPYALCKCLVIMFGAMYHPGVLKPLLIEVADPKRRSSIIAWETSLEGTVAALIGAPLVGFLSEHVFGYEASPHAISTMNESTRMHNEYALAESMAVMMLVPLGICFAVNSWIHWAYPRDRALWAAAAAAREQATNDIEVPSEKQVAKGIEVPSNEQNTDEIEVPSVKRET